MAACMFCAPGFLVMMSSVLCVNSPPSPPPVFCFVCLFYKQRLAIRAAKLGYWVYTLLIPSSVWWSIHSLPLTSCRTPATPCGGECIDDGDVCQSVGTLWTVYLAWVHCGIAMEGIVTKVARGQCSWYFSRLYHSIGDVMAYHSRAEYKVYQIILK